MQAAGSAPAAVEACKVTEAVEKLTTDHRFVHFVPLGELELPCDATNTKSLEGFGLVNEDTGKLSKKQRADLLDAIAFCGDEAPVVASCQGGNNRCKLLAALVQVHRGVPVTNAPVKPYFKMLVERAEANGVVDERILSELEDLHIDTTRRVRRASERDE